MFNHIMVPVDLHMSPEIQKALDVAGQIAGWQNAKITVVSVTSGQPGDVTQSGGAVSSELQALVDRLAGQRGTEVTTLNIHSVDVAPEVDRDLTRAAEDIGADLIVVGTHAPRITDYIFSSHAGYLAKHAKVSVFVVR